MERVHILLRLVAYYRTLFAKYYSYFANQVSRLIKQVACLAEVTAPALRREITIYDFKIRSSQTPGSDPLLRMPLLSFRCERGEEEATSGLKTITLCTFCWNLTKTFTTFIHCNARCNNSCNAILTHQLLHDFLTFSQPSLNGLILFKNLLLLILIFFFF